MDKHTAKPLKEGVLSNRRVQLIDAQIGSRIKEKRVAAGMSQERLGEQLGVSFQQIQKYELGLNRVSAGRLHRIATILHSPLNFFFGDFDNDAELEADVRASPIPLFDEQTMEVATAYAAIENLDTRKHILMLIQHLAEQQS